MAQGSQESLGDYARAVKRSTGAPATPDQKKVYDALNQFVLPYIALRNRKRGYAVSIVKAGMKVIGRSAGAVRSPLTDLTEAELAELATLVARVAKVEAYA